MPYRGSYGSYGPYGDPWATLIAFAVVLAAFLVYVTGRALVQIGLHLGRAFAREPSNPVLWALLVASLGLWGLTGLLASSGLTTAAVIVGVLAACCSVLLILVAITISLTSEQLLPTEPESLVTTVFKKSWW